jgi:CheY-like chemotaxis protein
MLLPRVRRGCQGAGFQRVTEDPLDGPTKAAPKRRRGARRALLVVDDDKLIRWTIREALRADYRVQLAATARRALDLLAGPGIIDGLLTDLHLPDMSGSQLIRLARAVRPGLKVFLMTANERETGAREAFGARADGFLTKPADLDTLRSMLACHLAGRR